MTLILASASPRRSELLQQIGVRFDIRISSVDETILPGEQAQAYVARTALAKAQAVAVQHPEQTVLGADTCISFQQKILTKPQGAGDAQRMLAALSGSQHQVKTAVALVFGDRFEVKTVTTDVYFNHLSRQQIEAYVVSQEPLDKAGAYGIQGFGAVLVERISGSYSNVVGLPLAETAAMLQNFNIPIWQK